MYEDRAPESVWRGPWWRRSAQRLWRSAGDNGDRGGRPLRLWATEDAVVVVRFDRVQAFRSATGAPLWTWRPPGEEVVALASADVQDGLGLVLHHDDGARETKQYGLTALDLGTGRVEWHRDQDPQDLGSLRDAALGGGRLAVSTGWQQPVLRTLDAHSGETLSERPLPGTRAESASVLLAEPFVLLVKGQGARSRPRLLVTRGTDDEATIKLPPGCARFGERLAVTGDVLAIGLVPTDTDDRDEGTRIAGFSLTSGEQLWDWQGRGSSYATVLAHRGWFLVLHSFGDRLSVLDPADGRAVARRRVRGYGFHSQAAAAGDLIVLGSDSSEDDSRLRAFRWR
ncbi:PQQ-binding-like beta-propeller repeat protein [Streptomyces sp. SID13726]|uniref:outer membrane protein assembly factor BamB family protein n=1 Tax=Streptomyces sp. SID13726 TaxID=2706058 RepID=UPI0013BB9A03|nr:PQQ-binding-like beta-propeller repeat protein [Streptomyces sp. SID13726]NEB00570.1 PQQ-binding-like beta-propeller repeat protein [Streptomyces sp. SID13726]